MKKVRKCGSKFYAWSTNLQSKFQNLVFDLKLNEIKLEEIKINDDEKKNEPIRLIWSPSI